MFRIKKECYKSIIIVLLSFIILNGLGIFIIEKYPILLEVHYNKGNSRIVGDLTDYRAIDQYFINKGNTVEDIKVLGATYGQSNCQGTLIAQLYNSEDLQIIDETKIDIAEITDNSYINLNFKTERSQVKNKKLILRLYAIETGDNKITLWMNDNYNTDMYVIIDGKLGEGSLIFSSTVLNTSTGYKILLQLNEIVVILEILYFIIKQHFLKSTIKESLNNSVYQITSYFKRNIKAISIFCMISLGILLLSCILEYGIGQAQLSKANSKDIQSITTNNIILENITLTPEGSYITETDNNTIIISNDQYIHNFNITLVNNIGNNIRLLSDGNEIENKSGLYAPTRDNIFNEVDKVFKVKQEPQELRIIINQPGVQINNLSIDNSYYFNWYEALFIFSICELIYLIVVLYAHSQITIANLFLSISLIVGSTIAITLPITTLVSWDDEIHYIWALEQSSLIKVNKRKSDEIMQCRLIPRVQTLREAKQFNQYLDSKSNQEIITEYYKKSIFVPYNRLGHLPAGIVIGLTRLLHLPFHIQFILGRLVNTIIYSIIIYIALRKLKTSKMIMALIALFPTALFLSANYAYDWWVTAFTMLGIAYFLNEAQQPNKILSQKNIWIMIIAFIIGLGPKAIYFPLIAILFLMPKSKFKSERELNIYRLLVIGSIIIVVGSFLAPFIIKGKGGNDMRGGEDVNSGEQIKFMLTHPIQYTNILLTFIKEYISFDKSKDYITFWAYLGHTKYQILFLITTAINIFIDKNEYNKQTDKWLYNIFVWFLCFITTALFATSLYISFTPVAHYTINGCQGRYILPVLFPFLALLGSSKIQNGISEKWYALVTLLIPTYILFESIWNMCIKIYL